jgi:DNA-binding beta-propeller fold protein YncE
MESGMMLPVARTRDEARLYLDLTPCACGEVDADWQHATGLLDGELVSVYDATCPNCDAEREYTFGLPEHETAAEVPNFGGPEPSQLIDPGHWMALADQLAGNLPADDPETVTQALQFAAAAVAEVIKFIPPGETAVPADAFWTPEGRAAYEADPGRFHRTRLGITQQTYRTT